MDKLIGQNGFVEQLPYEIKVEKGFHVVYLNNERLPLQMETILKQGSEMKGYAEVILTIRARI